MNKLSLLLIALIFLPLFFTQAAQAQSVTVQYVTTTDYGSGFQGQITIINNSSQVINGWTLAFDFDRTLSSFYNATLVSHAGTRYTVRNAGFNSTIPAGGSVNFGFGGSPGNVTVPPSNYYLNGTPVSLTATTFSYQGRLSDGAAAASGVYDLQFALYDDGGVQIGSVLTLDDVSVTNGIFTVFLDFGAAALPGANRALETRVRRGTETGAFTTLTPRQSLTAAPYAVRSVSAAAADSATNAQQLGGVAASQYVLTTDPRLTTTTTLNVSGSGTVGGDLTVAGTISSGCRSGFTAIAGGRLCVSAMQAVAPFYGTGGAVQTCISMHARVGTAADVTLALGQPGFDYFGGLASGWLGDYAGDNLRPRWNGNVLGDFDDTPINVYSGGPAGTAPVYSYRCVY